MLQQPRGAAREEMNFSTEINTNPIYLLTKYTITINNYLPTGRREVSCIME